MANTRRRSQRGGNAHMQTAPVMPAAMGGRPPVMMPVEPTPTYAEGGRRRSSRRSRHRGGAYNMMKPAMGGRPPLPQFMPGAQAPPPPVYEEGGGRRRSGKTRKASPWNLFVKKVYGEMKKKHGKGASFSDALKEASRRKKEM